MKIKREKHQTLTFDELEYGEVFALTPDEDSTPFMKTNFGFEEMYGNAGNGVNCVNLFAGRLGYVSPNTEVILHRQSELILYM